MSNLLENPAQYKRNSLGHKQSASARRLVYRMAGYLGESLSTVGLARKLAKRGMQHARDAATFAIYSRELDRWLERERILLRIPLPRSDAAPRQASVLASAQVMDATPEAAPDPVSGSSGADPDAQSPADPEAGSPS